MGKILHRESPGEPQASVAISVSSLEHLGAEPHSSHSSHAAFPALTSLLLPSPWGPAHIQSPVVLATSLGSPGMPQRVRGVHPSSRVGAVFTSPVPWS